MDTNFILRLSELSTEFEKKSIVLKKFSDELNLNTLSLNSIVDDLRVSGGNTFLFTSESVTEGQADKLCDQISDAVLDACLGKDPESKVACETSIKNNHIWITGQISTGATVDYVKTALDVCRAAGYTSDDAGFEPAICKVEITIDDQSMDVAEAVHGHFTKPPIKIGAGDQGMVFGYATDETEELMPMSFVLATKLSARLAEVRRNGICPWLKPDGKTQVTLEYQNDKGAMVPIRAHTIVISAHHSPTLTQDEIAAELKEHLIKPVIPSYLLDKDTVYLINPAGRFTNGGPCADAGLTGRKIVVDTYGGWGAHGGGSFSGKDPSKVDRSGAYIARQAAKSIVASKLARRCLVHIAYAMGVPEPIGVTVDTYGTGKLPDTAIVQILRENFNLKPGMIALELDLKRGGNRYLKTASYGHFGREDPDFTWEKVKPIVWKRT